MLQPKTTIAIVDDHPVVIAGLIKLLNKVPSFKIIGGFTTGAEFISFLAKTPVQIVLLDIILPDISGIELCKEIKAIAPDTIVLAFSNHQERSAMMQMLTNGANGYILKDASIDEIVACIQVALSGKIAFSKVVSEIISRPPLNGTQKNASLTVREKEILNLVATGLNTKGIAELLFLSKFTVENHRKNLLQKLNAKNVADLISIATRQGLL